MAQGLLSRIAGQVGAGPGGTAGGGGAAGSFAPRAGENYGTYTQRLLAGAGEQGYFDPRGSDPLMRALERRALRSGRSRRRRGEVMARILGLSPDAARAGMFDIDRGESGRVANLLGEARYGQLAGAQDFYRNLFGRERGLEFQSQQAERDRELAREQARQSLLGGIGGTVGSVAGAYLGRR